MNPELRDVNVHAPTAEERHREQLFREHGGKDTHETEKDAQETETERCPVPKMSRIDTYPAVMRSPHTKYRVPA